MREIQKVVDAAIFISLLYVERCYFVDLTCNLTCLFMHLLNPAFSFKIQ